MNRILNVAGTIALAALLAVVGLALAQTADLQSVTLKIRGQDDMEGMVCDGCTQRVKTALESVDGVEAAEVDLAEQRAVVSFDAERATIERMKEAVADAGFSAAVDDQGAETAAAGPVAEATGVVDADGGCCGACSADGGSRDCCGTCSARPEQR